MESIDKQQIRQDWIGKGAVSKSFKLKNPEIIEDVLRDMPMYMVEVARNRDEKLYRVPYLLTESIIKMAHDPTILEVVKAALDTDELVMWGCNMQTATPNEAGRWHTDIESWLWPSITLVIGLDGCRSNNSTRYIPYTHQIPIQPWKVADNANSELTLKAANVLNQKCVSIDNFPDFEDGKFYLFNAKCWHAGAAELSRERKLLFLHYDKASNPRIPYMKNYEERTWFDFPATYIKIDGCKSLNLDVYNSTNKDYIGTPPENFGYYKL